MSRVEQIEGQAKELRPEKLAAFREWFAAFDAEAWDRQFEADVIAGKLDDIAERALRDHATGRSTVLRSATYAERPLSQGRPGVIV